MPKLECCGREIPEGVIFTCPCKSKAKSKAKCNNKKKLSDFGECPHKGLDVIRTEPGATCGTRRKKINVYECSLHGLCSRQRVKSKGVKHCLPCSDSPWFDFLNE